MITTNSIMDTGIRALRTFQIALSVTAHNMANIKTDGYSRQRADLGTSLPLENEPGQIGTGVEPLAISRLRMTSMDASIWNEISQLGQNETHAQSLTVIEDMLGEPSDGHINASLTTFWNGWQDLTSNPSDLGIRRVVIENGTALTDVFRDSDRRLTQYNNGLNQTLDAYVDEANFFLETIARLNREINSAELGTGVANDLRDRRDLYVEKLAEFTDLRTVEQADGTIDLTVGGTTLVTGFTYTALSAVLNAGTGHMEVRVGAALLPTTSGKFQGFEDSYASLDSTRASLDTLAAAVISNVNTLHQAGFTLSGTTPTNQAFFSGTDAGTIDVNAALRNNAGLIAAAGALTRVPGGAEVALQIAQLRDTKVLPAASPTLSLNEYFRDIALTVGASSRQVQSKRDIFEQSVEDIRTQRASISGVNMDEEVTNMLIFQRAFQAASRVITSVDDMLERLVNGTGRVGL